MPEFASTSAKVRGQSCELHVAQHFQKKDYKIIYSNHRVRKVEVDLILFKAHWLMIEVKSLSSLENLPFRLKLKQRERLLRAHAAFADSVSAVVEFRVVYVLSSGEMIELALEDHY